MKWDAQSVVDRVLDDSELRLQDEVRIRMPLSSSKKGNSRGLRCQKVEGIYFYGHQAKEYERLCSLFAKGDKEVKYKSFVYAKISDDKLPGRHPVARELVYKIVKDSL